MPSRAVSELRQGRQRDTERKVVQDKTVPEKVRDRKEISGRRDSLREGERQIGK